MPNNKNFWSWVVFVCGLGAYIPLLIGGWKHPAEMNVACFGLWTILAASVTWASWIQKFSGWKLQAAFLVGNIVVVSMALIRGGYTFNIGPSETIALYGIVVTIGTWVTIGTFTKQWKPRILYLGSIAADAVSFYPQMKQYILPHEPPTAWMLCAWTLFALGAFLNVLLVEEMPKKLGKSSFLYITSYGKRKNLWEIIEESAFSLENFILIVITTILMCR